MIANEPDSQEDSAKIPSFITSSNEKIGRPIFMQPRWKLAGIDQEGGHHVLQTDDNIIYAIQDREVIAKERLDDWRAGRTISDWQSYVAQQRGWRVFYLQIFDFPNAFDNMGGHPRQ